MAYDENLAFRVKTILGNLPGLMEKKMFGGIGYLLNGNMACGIHKEYLIVRVGPDQHQSALEKPHARVFDITGRPMTGWVMVAPDGFIDQAALVNWVQMGLDFAATLPQK
jgi:TfoX/Sxy family transcriptional regulator of competence genes